MSDSASKSPATLASALERLSAAVDRLELVVAATGEGSNAEFGAGLKPALADHARLRETHAVVAEQLGVTIARLRGALDD